MSFSKSQSFLLDKITSIETINIDGSDDGFEKFLKARGIPVSNEYWSIDHSIVNWNQVSPHFQFNFERVEEIDLSNWLLNSRITDFQFLYTWLNYVEPIIKIRTNDFVSYWQDLNIYSGWEGLVLTTESGELFLEFTDDWKTHLNSNFQIKP
ncbi:MAG: hypothetical protein JJ966_09375 [Balneolaceae bacterium]|nr:hypothetical protein [Balneolaceae bacterium]